MDNEQYQCNSDDQLSKLLHQEFVVKKVPDVEIIDSKGNSKIITAKEYRDMLRNVKRASKMNPAEKLIERNRLKNKYENKLISLLQGAKVHTVDINDESNFGIDIKGKEIDMEDMTFLLIVKYPKKVTIKENEIGAFYKEDLSKNPIRILSEVQYEP